MQRWPFCTAILVGCTAYGYGEAFPGASTTGPDLDRCLSATEAANAKGWTEYCDSLSPASRRSRCAEQQAAARKSQREWCSTEWRNIPPESAGAWMPLASAAEANLPGQCQPEPPFICCPDSPIVIDVRGNGFDLTDAAHGVTFDIRADGRPVRVGWTSAAPEDSARAPDDVWLALDRNQNGLIDDGSELFGNYTRQPPSRNPHGFIALAEFDKAATGGNGDSRISSADRVFARLRLWSDGNHNGISEGDELFTLPELGVVALSLDYQVSLARDEHGNAFRYRARAYGAPGSRVGPFAYDVFLVTGPDEADAAPPALASPAAGDGCGSGCICEGELVWVEQIGPGTADACSTSWKWFCHQRYSSGGYRNRTVCAPSPAAGGHSQAFNAWWIDCINRAADGICPR
jgi:hypothetical protein